MDIGIDFDGTVVTHEYPNVGRDVGAVHVLKALTQNGHRLILNTMRSGKPLMEAVAWFNERRIPLAGVNLHPEQQSWTTSPKVFAHLYIDDMALGTPLIKSHLPNERPFVDWDTVTVLLKESNILPVDFGA